MTEPKTNRNLTSLLLLAACIAVAVAGSVWTSWDMFGSKGRPVIQGWDDSHYYFWLPSVVIDHDVDFSNQLANTETLPASAKEIALSQPRTEKGLLPNKYPPGWALGSLPFFLAAHVTAPAGSTGFEPRYMAAVWFGQLLYAAAGLWFAIKIVSRFFPGPKATIAVLGVWLASPLVYYQSARLSMSHSQVFALLAATTWIAFRISDGDMRKRSWFSLGFCAALLLVTRNVAVVFLLMPAVIVAPRVRTLGFGMWIIAGAALPVAVQLLAWKALYGSWIVYSYGGESLDPFDTHFVELLFSPRHGWFNWHPLMLVTVAGFVAWAAGRFDGLLWLLSLVAIIAINAMWPTWWFGSSFGCRGLSEATLFAMVGGAALWTSLETKPRLRTALLSFGAIAIVWNLLLLTLFLTHGISREGPVSHVDVLRAVGRWFGAGG